MVDEIMVKKDETADIPSDIFLAAQNEVSPVRHLRCSQPPTMRPSWLTQGGLRTHHKSCDRLTVHIG
jgi:hypothetical protein